MFLGAAGVGKTSLRRSLMRQPWESGATSTLVADLHAVRPSQWMEGGLKQWQQITHKDEIKELAKSLATSSVSNKATTSLVKISRKVPANDDSPPDVSDVKKFYVIEKVMVEAPLREASRKAGSLRYFRKSLLTRPFLHIWDCGGQPVFLETLPAFLTSHTMFLLLFDASKDFNSRWQSVQYQDGREIPGEMENVSTLNLLQQWMANIHANLVTEGVTEYPRIMAIGTHGDKLTQNEREAKKKEFRDHCKDKAYYDLLEEEIFIVDNTSARKPGEEGEDPQFAVIRCKISEFTSKKLAVSVPISWVLFRKVIQVVKKNVVSLEDARAIGVACKIPQEDVCKVLTFYHELGVVLFYPHIPGLRDKIIIHPQWFVGILGKILVLEGRKEGGKTARMWEALHKDGVLLTPLCMEVWSDCSINPQGILELIIHCYLAAPMEVKHYRDKFPYAEQFFIPAVLPIDPSPVAATFSYVKRATPLHITFSTEFVYPGFFTRLATSLIQSLKWQILFDDGVYRNRLTFSFQDSQDDMVVLTDMHHAIQVDVLCYVEDDVLPKVCHDVLHSLEVCKVRVCEALGSRVQAKIKFVCSSETCQSQGKPPHYLHINPNHTPSTKLCCEMTRRVPRREPLPEEACWFLPNSKESSSTALAIATTTLSTCSNSQTRQQHGNQTMSAGEPGYIPSPGKYMCDSNTYPPTNAPSPTMTSTVSSIGDVVQSQGKSPHCLHIYNPNHTPSTMLCCEMSTGRAPRCEPLPEEACSFLPNSKESSSTPLASATPSTCSNGQIAYQQHGNQTRSVGEPGYLPSPGKYMCESITSPPTNVPTPTMTSTDTKKLRHTVERVVIRMWDTLSESLYSDIDNFADKMFAKEIISRDVRRGVKFNDIMDSFLNAMKFFKTVGDFRDHCSTLLDVLTEVGGTASRSGHALRGAWNVAVKEMFGIEFLAQGAHY